MSAPATGGDSAPKAGAGYEQDAIVGQVTWGDGNAPGQGTFWWHGASWTNA